MLENNFPSKFENLIFDEEAPKLLEELKETLGDKYRTFSGNLAEDMLTKGPEWEGVFHKTGLIGEHQNIFWFSSLNLSLKVNYDIVSEKINEVICKNITNYFDEKSLEEYDLATILHENPISLPLTEYKTLKFTDEKCEVETKEERFMDKFVRFLS